MIRTFIAVDVPESVRQGLQALQNEFRKTKTDVSWVKPGSIHLTLKFLGNIEEALVPRIGQKLQEACEAAKVRPFRLQPKGCGVFPNFKRVRVVWTGLGGEIDILKVLQKQVDSKLEELGFEAESRPFKGHLTLGRVKGRRNIEALQKAIIDHQDFALEDFDVSALVLYKSDLRLDGARYTSLQRIAFSR